MGHYTDKFRFLTTPGSLEDAVAQIPEKHTAKIIYAQDNAGTRIKIQYKDGSYIAGHLGNATTWVEAKAGMVIPPGGKLTLKGTTGQGEAYVAYELDEYHG